MGTRNGRLRSRPADLKAFYKVAKKNPGMAITFTEEEDRAGVARLVKKLGGGRCAGIRPLRPEPRGVIQDELCAGADHWYSVSLQAENELTLSLSGETRLRIELYGIRGLTAIAGPSRKLNYRVPKAEQNRGARYIRIYDAGGQASAVTGAVRKVDATTSGASLPYGLRIRLRP
jgi:hypothetical protein